MNLSQDLRLQLKENPESETEIKAKSSLVLVYFPHFADGQC